MPVLMRTGEIGNGARQQYASNPGAQLGSSASFVACFFAEILPKEAKGGGARTVAKLAIFGGCMMSFGGGYFFMVPRLVY
jgi:hypothetical protein